jgi:anti-sigma B factor antagonist
MTQEGIAPAHDLKFATRKTPEATVIQCSGRISWETIALLQNAVQPLIPGCKILVLDLTQVDFIDSSGIGTLVKLWFSTKKAGGEFKVLKLNERIKDLFRISNLSKMLEGDQEYHKYLEM